MARIGVFICHCGRNIAGSVDIEELKKQVAKIPDVVFVTNYPYLCSAPGQELVVSETKKQKFDAIVTAHCSPTLHEKTFHNCARIAGLNQYRHEVANIREQASWPHWDEPEMATKKAFTIIRETVAKVKRNLALEQIKIPVTRKAMVIGGGIAGMQTALDIADGGYEVYLVEKDPSIGGKMLQLSETFPTLDCPQCIATPKMNDVGNHPNINLMVYSEVEKIDGYIGNFKVTVRHKASYVDTEKCTGCGECTTSCPVHNEAVIMPQPNYSESVSSEIAEKIEPIISSYKAQKSALVQIMLDVNEKLNYLPKDSLKYISEKLDLPLSKVYQVATFYNAFSLTPRGEHTVKVCLGTACHSRGASLVLSEVERILGIKNGETTQDKKFTLETVGCLGCCAMGPVVTIDGEYFHADPPDVQKLLDKFAKEEAKDD